MKTAKSVSSFAAVAAVSCSLAVNAAAPGRHLSGDYLMSVDGKPVDVVRAPLPEAGSGCIRNRLEWQPYSYSVFEASNEVEVVVQSGFLDLSKTEILPRSKGVAAVSQSVDTVVFKMTPPMTLVLEPKGRHRALVLSANLPTTARAGERTASVQQQEGTACEQRMVRRFEAGFHDAGLITLGDDETLYLAPGAWVEGCLKAEGRNIRVCGCGVLSGAKYEWLNGNNDCNMAGGIQTFAVLTGENIEVKDVTFFSSYAWTLVFNNATNVVVDNIKVIGGRVINDDGIDICRTKDIVIRNSFIRTQDDCITPKFWCENLVCTNMTLWTESANAFRTGYECAPRESGLVYRNLLFKDIDVLHLSLNKNTPDKYWANCAIYIQPAHGQTMYNTVYEDLRFHEVGPGNIFLNVKTMPITTGSADVKTDEPGYIQGLTLRNIHLPDAHGGMCVNFSAHDDAHPIEGVRFENVTGYGPFTKSGKVEFVE